MYSFCFLIGLIFGCITGLISKKGIHIEITYKGEKKKEGEESERPK